LTTQSLDTDVFNNGKSGHTQRQNDRGDITEHFDRMSTCCLSFLLFGMCETMQDHH